MNTDRNSLLTSSRAVLFDLDGTLLDTARDLVHALHQVCDEQSQPAPDGGYASRHVSTGAIGLVRLAFPDRSDDELEPLRQRLVEIYENNLVVHTVAYPGIAEMLNELDAANVRWGVVTNKLRYLAEPIMDRVGLLDRCATLVGGDTATHNKPHPAPIQLALDEMGVPPEAAVYVGDAEKDIQAGSAAGTRTIAVTWGYILPGQNPSDWQADFIVDTPAELLTLES